MRLDLFWALRWLFRNPSFTAAIVFILALGIGANTAVFSIVDAVLLRPSPYPSAHSLVRIEERSARAMLSGVPVKDYQRWADRSDVGAQRTSVLVPAPCCSLQPGAHSARGPNRPPGCIARRTGSRGAPRLFAAVLHPHRIGSRLRVPTVGRIGPHDPQLGAFPAGRPRISS